MINALTKDEIINQLVEIYNKYESAIRGKLMDKEQAIHYHKTLFDRGNIIVYEEGGQIRGYVEIWKLTFEQFGKIICNIRFNADSEEITSGNIAYVANIFIFPEYRRSTVIQYLRNEFFKRTFKCDYFCGNRIAKKSARIIKVFKKEDLINKLYIQRKD